MSLLTQNIWIELTQKRSLTKTLADYIKQLANRHLQKETCRLHSYEQKRMRKTVVLSLGNGINFLNRTYPAGSLDFIDVSHKLPDYILPTMHIIWFFSISHC